MSSERWKDVIGFEGFYRVSDTGRVASCDIPKGIGQRSRKGRELRLDGDQPQVMLVVHGERFRFSVARLVASHFIRKLADNDCVFHKNLDKKDNNVCNLLITTFAEAQRLTRESLFDYERIERNAMTAEKAAEYLEYCTSGRLFWKRRTSPNVAVGTEAGFANHGHWNIHFLGNTYTRNQLVYLLHHGRSADYVLPINGDYMDSRIENLRAATASEWATISGRRDNLTARDKR